MNTHYRRARACVQMLVVHRYSIVYRHRLSMCHLRARNSHGNASCVREYYIKFVGGFHRTGAVCVCVCVRLTSISKQEKKNKTKEIVKLNVDACKRANN